MHKQTAQCFTGIFLNLVGVVWRMISRWSSRVMLPCSLRLSRGLESIIISSISMTSVAQSNAD